MSRYLYWTILIGDEPTSFRAAEAAELKPTLVQLRRTNPDARLVWFERGRIWGSPAEAQTARLADRAASRGRPSTWRPGGRHVDPRQKYKDAKKAKWTRFKEGIRRRSDERAERAVGADEERPKRTTAEILADWQPPPGKAGVERPTPASDRPPARRPFKPKPEGERRERPPRADWKPRENRSDWTPRGAGNPGAEAPGPQDRTETRRPRGGKPQGARSDRPRFGAKAGSKPGGKPGGGTFARPKSDRPGPPRPPRPRGRDDRGPRKPRKN